MTEENEIAGLRHRVEPPVVHCGEITRYELGDCLGDFDKTMRLVDYDYLHKGPYAVLGKFFSSEDAFEEWYVKNSPKDIRDLGRWLLLWETQMDFCAKILWG